jgi:hypothetical protein
LGAIFGVVSQNIHPITNYMSWLHDKKPLRRTTPMIFEGDSDKLIFR